MPSAHRGEGTHLQRYARLLPGVEINSSFYRPHARATYARWAASTPTEFRFAVKMPRDITHDRRLQQSMVPLQRFLDECAGLGDRRGPLLMQLPPSFAFASRTVGRFLAALRQRYDGPLVCEPRHASWFDGPAETLLSAHHVARVAADPPVVPGAHQPGGWSGLAYFRMHGSPRMYWSPYLPSALQALAEAILVARRRGPVWCVFDNTASGAAFPDATSLHALMD